jgi:hypothetical protein
MCFVRISEQTAIFSLYNINWLIFITEMESVYCAVRTGSLYIKQIRFVFDSEDRECRKQSTAARWPQEIQIYFGTDDRSSRNEVAKHVKFQMAALVTC